MSHREPRGVRDLHEKLQLVLQRRVFQVRLLMSERPTVNIRPELFNVVGTLIRLGFGLAVHIHSF